MAFKTTPRFPSRQPPTAFSSRSARGNVFAMLFAAVTLTGVLASVGMQTLTGPVTTITRVTQKNIADNNLLMNVKILVAAAVSGTGGGDPDNDGMIEPAEYIAPGGGEAAPTGGGFLPTTLGLVLTDPWGTRYGYCVWDHGTSNSSSRRLAGDNTDTASTQPVIAIIAAGPDKIFQTSCAAYTGGTVSVAKQGGSDDLVFRYTYAEATASSNGLWTLSPTDQAKAELKDSTGIANVTIDRATGIGRFYGIVTDTLAATTGMLTVDGALKLDDQTGVTTCGAAEAGVVRYNAASSKLEVCNGSAWKPAGSSEATYVTRTPSDDLESEQALSLLPSGILKVTTGTGTIASGAVDLGGAEASGILAAGRFPALTGEVTTTEGSLATSVADDVLDFSEFADAMTLDASTDIAVTGSNVLSVTNTGTGNSLVINDEGGDTTPFVIDADGKVGIGTATLGQSLLTVSASGNASVLTVGTTFGTFVSQAGTTTGIFQADAGGKVYVGAGSNHPVGLLAGTTERISILADGNVGIGTFTPSARLEIAGGLKIAGHAACAAGGTNNGTLRFETTLKKMQLCIDGTWANVSSIEKLDDIGDIYLSESGNTEPGNNEVLAWNAENDRWEARNINTVGNAIAAPGGSDKQIQFNDGGTLAGAAQLFWDKTNNRLGLGTSTPGSKLTLFNGDLEFAGGAMPRRLGYATSNAVEQFTYDGDLLGHYALNWYYDSTLGGLSLGISDYYGINFLTSGASRMVITSSGNLGIGTTTPRAKLDIVGGARLGADAVCSASKAGMLTWNTNVLQLCTDTGAFVALASSAGPALPSADTLDFSEFKDAMTLDASTDIAVTGSYVLSITNTGTSDTLVVNDEAADATPFVISGAGNVGIGTATPTQKLTVSGATDGQIRVVNTATGSSELKLYDTTDGGWSLFSQDGVFRIGKLGTTGSWLSNHIALDATGSLSIGTSAADASALLDVASTSKGFLPPRMTSAQVSAIAAPTNGLLVYDTDIGRYRAYQGGSWQQILTSASGNIADDQLDFDKFRDAMTLDASTDIAATGANVLSITNTGTGRSFLVNDEASDATPFVVDESGNVGIGTSNPASLLHLARPTGSTILQLDKSAGQFGYLNFTTAGSRRWHVGVSNSAETGANAGSDFYINRAGDDGAYLDTPLFIVRRTGNVGIGMVSPPSLLSVASTGYAQFLRDSAGPPLAADCDAAGEFGRIVIDSTNDRWYVCEGAAGWKYVSIGATGGSGAAPLSAITAATAANTIANATNPQVWNWALTGATADAFTFGESTAATSGTAGDQSILKVSTLASSTATPLIVTNLGNGPSFKVNDETGDTDATPFVVDASGNVGVGTSTPQSKVHVQDNTAAIVSFSNSTSGNLSTDGMYVGLLSGNAAYMVNRENSPLYLATNDATRVTISGSGNVGIGTTSPAVKLAVAGGSVRVTNDTAAPFVHIQAPDVSMGAPALILQAQKAAAAPLQTGDWLGYVDWRNTAYSASARILGVASETQSDTAAGGTLRFQTTANGSTTLTDRLTILHNGNVGIGTNAPAAALHIKGGDTFFEYGTNGFLRTTADASAVYLQPAPQSPTLGTFRDLRIGPWMSNTSYLTVKDGGNVGIGTLVPDAKLDIRTTTGPNTERLRVMSASNAAVWLAPHIGSGSFNPISQLNDQGIFFQGSGGNGTGNLVIAPWADATSGIRITSLGNVGIGTTAPAAKLDVKGTLRLSGSTSGFVGLAPAAAAGSTTYTLPASDGTAGQVLSTNGAGTLAWSSVAGGAQLTPSASAPATCDAGSDGRLGLTMEYRMCVCRNGSGWVIADGGVTACPWNQDNTPAAFAFTDLTGQALGALTTSNTVTITGIGPAAVAVSVTGTATPELSIAGGTWATSGTIANNQTLQLRLTSAPTSLTMHSATVIVGNVTDQWDITTLNDPCAGSPSVGTVCTDGSVYAGLSADGNVAMYVTRCDLGQTWSGSACTGTRSTPTWNDGTSNWLDTSLANCNDSGGTGAFTGTATTCWTGKSNSAFLLTADSATTAGTNPHHAAKPCEDLAIHGKSDWYLPSLRELWDLHPNRTAIGNLLTDGSWYWSSSEYNPSTAWLVRFSDGSRLNYSKNGTSQVRCARR